MPAPESQSESMVLSSIGPLIRAALSSTPFAGGVAALWCEWDTSRRFKRVESTVKELGDELSRSKTFDPSKLGEAEMQLLEDGLERAAREHREAKRSMFARLLATNWVRTETPFDERLLFHRALDEFDEVHLMLLHILRDAHQKGEELVQSKDLCARAFGSDADDQAKFGIFVPALNKLAAEYGFVRRKADSDGRLMLGINPDGLVFHVNCLLAPLGRRFIESLQPHA